MHATSPTNATPLIWASEMGSTECVKDLLDAGADPNEFEFDGWSALHWAARNGHLGIVKLLLERGASFGQQDSQGHTPLDWAIDREHWDVVSVLKQWSDENELGRLDSTSQLHWTQAIRKTGQLWDSRP